LSWIDPDPDVRKAAVQRINEHVDFASEYGAPLAIGYIRGRQLDPDPVRAEEQKRLVLDCCCECAKYAEGTGVILAFEPINRYEVDYVHTIDQAIDFVAQVDSPAMGILADTYHMNIEEASMEDAFKRAGKLLSHIHLVDNNRLAPGFGHMDFPGLLGALQEAGYEGYLSLEVLPLPSPEEAASRGIAYVKGVLDDLPQGG
jgi:sugar phosphate isomerase/epimerase